MSPFLRMKRSWRPCPLLKKGPPISSPERQIPQFNGTPGWIFLTHDTAGAACAAFTDSKFSNFEPVSVVIDERLCCDTIFRAVKLSPNLFVLYDIYVLNGTTIHPLFSYAQRQERLANLLAEFHFPDLAAFVTVEEAPVSTLIRGYEQYDNVPGTIGTFVEHLPVEK